MEQTRIVIAWQDEPFQCEFKAEHLNGWLQMFRSGQLVVREPVESVQAAYHRARELAQALKETRELRRRA
jgi:hypothetical protein